MNVSLENMVEIEKRILCKILFRITLFSLLMVLFVAFYMQDEMSDYLLHRTTISTRFEEKDTTEFPTITVCMRNGVKASVAKKFGLALNVQLLYDESVLKTSKLENLTKARNQLSYMLNRDFDIQVSGKSLKTGKNIMGGGYELEVEPIHTLHSLTCYKLQVNNSEEKVPVEFRMKFMQTVEKLEDRSKGVDLLLTSNDTWIGNTQHIWPQFKPTMIYVPFDSGLHGMKITVVEHRFDSGVNDTKKCVTDVLSRVNCPFKCSALPYNYFPPCRFTNESSCMLTQFRRRPEVAKCFFKKRALTFQVHHETHTNHTISPSIWPSDMVTVVFFLWSPRKEINEEIRIITV